MKKINLDKFKKEIIDLYNLGNKSSDIAKIFNISSFVIINELKKWNIKIRYGPEGQKGSSSSHWTGYKEISGSFYLACKNNALQRNIPFNLTIKQIWKIYQKQNGKCALSGEKLKFNTNNRECDGNISIDRINSNKGYTIKNCQVVTKQINISKHILTNKEFLKLCTKIIEYDKSKNTTK